MSAKKKQKEKSPEELLQEALVPEEEQPYKIPENWVWTKIGSITEIVGGGTPKTNIIEYYENGDIPWITPADLTDYNDIYIRRGKRNITKAGLEKSSAKILPKDSVLLSSRAPIGYVAIAANELCTSQGFKSFKPSKAYIPHYCYWYLRYARYLIETLASGTTFREISGARAAQISYPLPPLPEQKRIVNRVESLLAKINEAKQLINEARETFVGRRAAILAKAFRGELTKKWREQNPDIESADKLLEKIKEEKVKQEQGKKRKRNQEELPPIEPPYELPEGWSWIRLCDFFEITGGGTPSKNQAVFWNGSIPWVSPKDMKTHQIYETINTITEMGLEYSSAKLVPKNSVAIVVRSGILQNSLPVAIIKREAVVNQDIKVFNSSSKKLNYLLFWYVIGHEQYLLNTYTKWGTTVRSVKMEEFKNLLLPVPPELELTELLNKIETNLESDERAHQLLNIEKNLNNIEQSILTKAFRGKLGTNNPNEESALELLKEIINGQANDETRNSAQVKKET